MAYSIGDITVFSIILAGLSNMLTLSANGFYLQKRNNNMLRSIDETFPYGGIYTHPVVQEKRLNMPADTPASNFICTHRVIDCRNGSKYAVFPCGDQECACVCPEEATELSTRLHNFKKFLARTGGMQKRSVMNK